MISEIEQKRSQVERLCQQYKVHQLQLFGSAATGRFVPEASDLDFLATFADTQTPDYADRYFDFAEALEKLFQRPVDIVTPRAIRNPYFRAEIERTAQVVYGPKDEKTLT